MARKTMRDVEHYVRMYNWNKNSDQPYVGVRRENGGLTVYWKDGNGDVIENLVCNLRTGQAYQIVRTLANSWFYTETMSRNK